MRKYYCTICNYVYDESAGIPKKGIAPGTSWEDIPKEFTCPICAAGKDLFKPVEETVSTPPPVFSSETVPVGDFKELSVGEISAICSNLAKGCEKQRLIVEMEAFNKLADYFKSKAVFEKDKTLADVAKMLDVDLSKAFSAANTAAKANADRGAQRSLVWSEKVSIMMKSLLERFTKEGEAMLINTKVYVCDICGFIYLGDTPPEICPVCKVPNYKMFQIEKE